MSCTSLPARMAGTTVLAILTAAAAAAGTSAGVDRTVLPIQEPRRPVYTELDARNAKMPPRFEVKAPEGAPNVVIVLQWSLLPGAFMGSIFLLALVWCASLMPVQHLPAASWPTALGLGFISSVFDNIPLTALALQQGNYDWGVLAYAVGFGGSMVWFGSSAGAATRGAHRQAASASSKHHRTRPVISNRIRRIVSGMPGKKKRPARQGS